MKQSRMEKNKKVKSSNESKDVVIGKGMLDEMNQKVDSTSSSSTLNNSTSVSSSSSSIRSSSSDSGDTLLFLLEKS